MLFAGVIKMYTLCVCVCVCVCVFCPDTQYNKVCHGHTMLMNSLHLLYEMCHAEDNQTCTCKTYGTFTCQR